MGYDLYYGDYHLESEHFSEIVDWIVVEILKFDKDSECFPTQYLVVFNLIKQCLLSYVDYPGNVLYIYLPDGKRIEIFAWV